MVADYATERGVYNDTIVSVVIDIAPDAEHDPDLVPQQRYRRQ